MVIDRERERERGKENIAYCKWNNWIKEKSKGNINCLLREIETCRECKRVRASSEKEKLANSTIWLYIIIITNNIIIKIFKVIVLSGCVHFGLLLWIFSSFDRKLLVIKTRLQFKNE